MKYSLHPIILTFALVVGTACPAFAGQQQTFKQWLEHYSAWDRLEHEYSQEAQAETPDAILKRAQVYLNLNSPQKALEIIEMTPAFSDPKLEAERLWLGGIAHRGLGNLSQAVLWFTQASQNMTKSVMDERFDSEPDLQQIWHDVWLKMYWSYSANYTLSKDSQKEALNMVLMVGKKVWNDDFWNRAAVLLNPNTSVNPENEPSELTGDSHRSTPLVSATDTDLIIQTMASISLEQFDEAYSSVSQLTNEPVRIFWSSLAVFMERGSLPPNLHIFEKGNYLKAHAFWAGNVLAPYSKSRGKWFLGNQDSGPWTQFRNNLLKMDFEEAMAAIDTELRSMLISEQTAALLNSFKLALALSNGNKKSASTIWNKIDKSKLPISLQVAGVLTFKDNLNNILPHNPAESYALYPILSLLSGAGGMDIHERTEAPFWTEAPLERLESLSEIQYPLDKLLLLAHLRHTFDVAPTVKLAKRAAFLFSDSSFGIQGLLYLADDVVKDKNLQLGAYYLNKIDETTLPSNLRMAWLDIKTRLELDSGRQATALTTYKEMVKTGETIPVMTRLRMALLFQQRREYEAAREELLSMWQSKNQMTTTLQAETLFWLGEGEYALKNTDKALDYYLKLAWKYPQENIWALTAMYRASLIYEKRGKYETAKKLLGTVVKNASRKEQREAATARITAIDKKMGKQEHVQQSTLEYPF
ncbi:tetratricopeptide repeat protein [Pseudodesulfovibrio sediminis]|uniref:Tetratricopeptide repeat protein n=1 Tax=Pseudodesulfovibrio sediminis TaxID=2810563 RepID=A0ABM7P313_9BACT|nr:tetratricopeptide repeat protein [Pseudodesulfovibrio sediminis]BCS87172.1 hypothetical protein PSDVSF_04140 [Pseudodesulfovibrio sediminis]